MRGSVALARRLRVPSAVVALSLVAFGTSLPELVVSMQAAMTGHPNLILGNVVGSNIANVLLVAGAAAVAYPLRLRSHGLRGTSIIMLLASLVFAGLCVVGGVDRGDGVLLLAGFVVVLVLNARAVARNQRAVDAAVPLDWVLGLPSKLPMIVFFIVIGVATLPVGADLLVDAAVDLAELVGVTETVIGLSVVAIGTSLPEVTTAVLAALRRKPAMALGTIIGSNTFNLLAIMGITAVISRDAVPVSVRFLSLDLLVMLAVSVALVGATFFARRIGRVAGAALLVAYVAYLFALYLTL